MAYPEEVLYAVVLGYACKEIERETLYFVDEWANSEGTKDRTSLLDYLYKLLRQGIIEPEQYVAVKELI